MDLWEDLDKISAFLMHSPTKILMLDFDGTLAPIVGSPKDAKLSEKMKGLLVKLSKKKGFKLAIISGRKLGDIKEKIKLPDIIYGGNHGLEGEILGEKYIFPVPAKVLGDFKKIKDRLNPITNKFKGTFIEDKGLTMSFHYRLAGTHHNQEITLLVNQALDPFIKTGLITTIANKKVIDIIPQVNWDKGDFASLIIKILSQRLKTYPVTVVIGDDITDEDIFRKLESQMTITVGKKHHSLAKYFLKDTTEVFQFLEWINSKAE